MGRPLTPIDAEEVYKLASIGCTQEEIAGFFGVDQATISRRFSLEYKQAHSQCKISLRKRQWNQSKKSVAMSIHLGKNILGQSDKIEAELSDSRVSFEAVDDGRDPQLEELYDGGGETQGRGQGEDR